jgi:hypothetical protein
MSNIVRLQLVWSDPKKNKGTAILRDNGMNNIEVYTVFGNSLY